MKILKKIIYWFFGFVLILVLSAFLLLKYFENDIFKYTLERIEKNINTEISFNKTKLSLFEYFPNVAITFYNVDIDMKKKSLALRLDTLSNRNCISVGEITIKINLLKLLRNPIVVSGIEIKNGDIFFLVDKYQNTNYQLKNTLSKNSQNLIFQVQKLFMSNINFKYLNEKSHLYINTCIKNIGINVIFQNSYSDFKVRASIINSSVFSNGSWLLREFNASISMYITSNSGIITLTNGDIISHNEMFKLKGCIFRNNFNRYNLTIQSKGLRIANLKNFNIHIPNNIALAGGQLTLYLNLFGKNKINSPINFIFTSSIKNLSFNYKSNSFKNINCKLNMNGNYGNSFKASFCVTEIKGNFYNSFFHIPILKYETSTDSIIGHGSIKFKCTDFNNLINDSILLFRKGEINLSFNLNSNLLRNSNFSLLKILENSHISFKYLDFSSFKNIYQISKLDGEIITSKYNLQFTHLYGFINGNSFSFKGNIQNYQSLFQNIPKKVEIFGELKSKYINCDSIISNKISENNHYSSESRNSAIIAKLNLIIDKITFSNITLSNFYSSMIFSDKRFLFNNINTNFCEGMITNGTINIKSDLNSICFKSYCEFKKINIDMLISSFNDFGQKEITSKNIKGKLTGNGNYKILWKDKIFSKKDFQGNFNFEIVDGELNGFSPIYKLSNFIELSELNNIKFKNISNKILINNNIVDIPLMNLNTSALNLSLSGSHSLDNKYEYHFKVMLSSLLSKKQKNKKKLTFDSFITDEDTLRMIYVKLQGDSNFYKFSYDSKFALKAFSDKIKIEKIQFKEILNEEFRIFSNDSSSKQKILKIENRPIIESDDIKQKSNEIGKDKKAKKDEPKNRVEWKDE
jgi:hypothetical protein